MDKEVGGGGALVFMLQVGHVKERQYAIQSVVRSRTLLCVRFLENIGLHVQWNLYKWGHSPYEPQCTVLYIYTVSSYIAAIKRV